MGIKTFVIKQAAKIVRKRLDNEQNNALVLQDRILRELINTAMKTRFGDEHDFSVISSYNEFKMKVPIRNYEDGKKYYDAIRRGEANVTWPGKPAYLAKTSGTTSGAKYIPISKQSINTHITAAQNALMCYVAEKNSADCFSQKMIFLQGSPVLEEVNGLKVGRLSGLVYHHVPHWLLGNRKPSYAANCIDDWETKVDAIVEETVQERMSLLSGIPPWCIMYFEKLLRKSEKPTIKALFPDLSLYVYGGLNYEPYREKMQELIGAGVDTIETFPASEGFFAFQDIQDSKGLLLNVNAGMFFEFIAVDGYGTAAQERVSLSGVKLQKQYVLIVSSNAGLWAYDTGDTVKFISKSPYRLLVTGRVKHFISAFGEHVIAEEVEQAIGVTAKKTNTTIEEFTVAPLVAKEEGQLSYHEWWVEFASIENLDEEAFVQSLDFEMCQRNVYYKDLREGGMLSMPKLRKVPKNGFHLMQAAGAKLGGQNKVQHLSNDRNMVNKLAEFAKL